MMIILDRGGQSIIKNNLGPLCDQEGGTTFIVKKYLPRLPQHSIISYRLFIFQHGLPE